jgi:GNAT superfamily N-acetyltransferase
MLPGVATEDLLAVHDAQLRGRVPERLPEGEVAERDGPVVRFYGGPGEQGWVLYRDLGGLEGAGLDELISRQVGFFRARNERFEWKSYGHDLPADLPERLCAHGFVPEPTETVVIARVDDIAGRPVLPEGVTLREVTERADFDRIAEMENQVWGDEHTWLADMLESERALDPDSVTIVVAEAGETVVCAAWIRFDPGNEFGTLWGGATLGEWRRRGIYRATVTYRANLAAARGKRYLETEASDDSNPILQRLGFVPVTTSTPYVWSPRASARA